MTVFYDPVTEMVPHEHIRCPVVTLGTYVKQLLCEAICGNPIGERVGGEVGREGCFGWGQLKRH